MSWSQSNQPLKSALRVATGGHTVVGAHLTSPPHPQAHLRSVQAVTPEDMRQLMLDEFEAWLGAQVSDRTKRPYQPKTIKEYVDAGRTLSGWMTSERITQDFTSCDTVTLNRFFARYLKGHTQGGTNTLQRNLAHLFQWLEETYGHANPYSGKLNRYAPAKVRPTTLAKEFIRDVLQATGGGKARNFTDARDHAIIRVFTEGARLSEVTQIQIPDLSPELLAQPYARVEPLKAARKYDTGRIVYFQTATGRALLSYLRIRARHKHADLPALWLGERGAMTASGLYQIVKKVTLRAGYNPETVWPHLYRHTYANDWLADGGQEGDLMRLMGWESRAMVDRYAADLAEQRAAEAKRRRGDMY